MPTQEERLAWNRRVTEDFRANAGVVAEFGGQTLILLHHTGAKSGTAYVSPLVTVAKPDGGWLIAASNGGRDTHPGWYHNLLANPETVIEAPGEDAVRTVKVVARFAGGAERDRLFNELIAVEAGFGEYQKGISRRIPVVVLEPVD